MGDKRKAAALGSGGGRNDESDSGMFILTRLRGDSRFFSRPVRVEIVSEF